MNGRKGISRRERPAKPALTRPGIVDAAVGIMRTEGLQKVTMRRLAQELDTGPASLYVYVANTAELHAAVLDEMLGDVDLAESSDQQWRDTLVEVLMSYLSVLLANPQLARSAITARPTGRNYLRMVDRILELLDRGGVPARRAAWGVDLLLQTATASAAEHAEPTPGTDEDWAALSRTLQDIDAERYPHVERLADDLLSGSPTDRLTWAFRVLIDGLHDTPAPGE
jgi:AcrR family transcriptional regulator